MLKKTKFKAFNLGAVKPKGWLKRQLKIQLEGLTGNLDKFWPDVAQSSWFGGDCEGWERAPYWLDGALPLAFLIDDKELKSRIKKYIDYIIETQQPSGWLGPSYANVTNPEATKEYDVWAMQLACKVLMQYHEVTGEEKALEAMKKCIKHLSEYMLENPLFNWGKYRWFEMLISTYYIYEKTGEDWALKVAELHHEQGFDWKSFFKEEDIKVPTPRRGRWKWAKHVVNLAMAIKGYPLWWRQSGDESDREFIYEMMDTLDKYHGQVTGVFTGDECVAGKNPVQGTELCAVAEYMYSLEQAIPVLGDVKLCDRLERIAFNAWPATFAPDMWSHQYDQQVNQVQVTKNQEYLWTTNGPESNLYGLEPNFGCCTANMHQGWPKFVANLWMQTEDHGVAAIAYAPSEVKFKSQGIEAKISLETEYPFREELKFKVEVGAAVTFPIMLRIPAWAKDATLTINGEKLAVAAGEFYRLEREWSATTRFELKLPMTATTTRRFNKSISIERGPLVYALKIEEAWTQINKDQPQREFPHCDWEVRATSAWNYALEIDENDLANAIKFEEQPIGDTVFSPAGAPMVAKVKARKQADWDLVSGWSEELRISPLSSKEPLEEVELIPYGCTNLRIAEFPKLK